MLEVEPTGSFLLLFTLDSCDCIVMFPGARATNSR